MKKASQKSLGLIAASLFAFGLFTSTPAYASSEPVPPVEGEPDRIIYVDATVPRLGNSARVIQSDSNAEVTIVERSALPVVPAPGETVRIVYTNGVTEITTDPVAEFPVGRAAAPFTKSITAEVPTRTSYPQARAWGQGSITSGCSGGSTLRVHLYTGLEVKASNSATVLNNGSTWRITASKTCGNSNSTAHYTLASWSSGGSSKSQSKSLACGYGFWG